MSDLLTFEEFNRKALLLIADSHPKWETPIRTKMKRVKRHFETDYSGSNGVLELKGKPIGKAVTLDIFDFDALLDPPTLDKPSWDALDVTPLILLDNGETLSDTEAIEGLGTFAPDKREKN